MVLTMQKIAEMAGVSRPVVSSVLGGKSTCRVSDEKRRKILEIVNRCGFSPDPNARSLRSGKTMCVGILYQSFRDRVIGAMMLEFSRYLQARNYTALYFLWDDANGINGAYRNLNRSRVDGILTSDYHPEWLVREVSASVYGSFHENADGLRIEYASAMKDAIAYLTSLGHRKIGYCGVPSERSLVWSATMEAFGLSREYCYETGLGYPESGVKAVRVMLARGDRPTALICHNDPVAAAAMAEASRAGLVPGRDISFIGIDNTQDATLSYPSLTTIDTFVEKKAGMMADMLLNRLEDPSAAIRHETISAKLVVRESCAERKPEE